MDIQEQIVAGLSKISDRQVANHLEVVQRLTALETRVNESPIKEFDERIKTLEGWRNKAVGFTVALNLFITGAIEWIHSHAK